MARPFELKFTVAMGDAIAQIKTLADGVAQVATAAGGFASGAKATSDVLNTVSAAATRNAETIATVATAAQAAAPALQAAAAAAAEQTSRIIDNTAAQAASEEELAARTANRARIMEEAARRQTERAGAQQEAVSATVASADAEATASAAVHDAQQVAISDASQTALLKNAAADASRVLSTALDDLAQAQRNVADVEREEPGNAALLGRVRQELAVETQRLAEAERTATEAKQAHAAITDRLAAAEKREAEAAKLAADAAKAGSFTGRTKELGDLVGVLGIFSPRLFGAAYGLQMLGGAVQSFAPRIAAAGGGVTGFVATLGPFIAGGTAAVATFYALAEAAGLVKDAIAKAIPQQAVETDFAILLGNTEAARERLEELDATAQRFNLPVEQVRAASLELTRFTQGALGSGKSLQLVVEGAARSGQSLSSVASVIGRAYESIEAGQSILRVVQQLEKAKLVSGNTANELKNLATEGKSIGEVWGTLETALAKYNGAAAGRAQTFASETQGVRTAWDKLLEDFGRPIVDALSPMLHSVAEAIQVFQPLAGAAGQAIGSFLNLAAEGMRVVAAVINGDFAGAAAHLTGLLTSAVPIVSSATALIGNLVRAGFDAVNAAIIGMGSYVVDALGGLFKKSLELTASFVTGVTNLMGFLPGNIKASIADGVNGAVDTAKQGIDAVEKLTQGVSDKASGAVATDLLAATKNALDLLHAVHNARPAAPNEGTQFKKLEPGATILPDTKAGRAAKDNSDLEARRSLLTQLSNLEREYGNVVKLTDVQLELGEKTQAQADQQNLSTTRSYLAQLKGLEGQLAAERDKLTAQPQTAKTLADLAKIKEAIAQVTLKEREMNLQAAKLTPLGNMRVQLTALAHQWGDLKTVVANTATSIAQSLAGGVSNAITGLINGTQRVGQAFAQMGQAIVATLVKVAVEYVASKLIMAAIDAVLGKRANSDSTQGATQVAAAWAPAATNVAIATEGQAAGTGVLAYIGALAAGVAASSALAGAGGGFQSGGYTGHGRPDEVAGLVHRREYVFDADATQHWGLDVLNAMGQMRIPVRAPRGLGGAANGASAAGGGYSPTGRAGGPRGGRGGQPVIHVHSHTDMASVQRFMKSNPGRHIVLDHVNGSAVDLNI